MAFGFARMARWIAILAAMSPAALHASEAPPTREGTWTAQNFRLHTGEIMPALKLHYTTIGDPSGEPVLILHGTGGTGAGFLRPSFSGLLFGPGQPLDARKYFIILPDSIGAGGSTKPSDGLKAAFPHYDYADLVESEYRLVTEGLGLHHLRLVLGNSMGGMETWVWGVSHPGFMDGLVPMASQPTPMAARNWMLRRMMIETIRSDASYAGGAYALEPATLKTVAVLFDLATNGGTLALQAKGATHAAADKWVDERLAAPAPTDANDWIWQWDASADYDPSHELGRVTASVLAINSADDERNPVETGVMAEAMKTLKNGRTYIIPASAETAGHGTTGFARFWAAPLADFLRDLPKGTN